MASEVIGNDYQEAPALSFLNTRRREPELKRSRESPDSSKSGVQMAVIYQWWRRTEEGSSEYLEMVRRRKHEEEVREDLFFDEEKEGGKSRRKRETRSQ